jgi:hypothetical protein
VFWCRQAHSWNEMYGRITSAFKGRRTRTVETKMHSVWADIILFLHALFIAFVVLSFILIVVGIVRQWHWTGSFWFRAANLLAIGIVAVNAWLGRICPLTIWENELREAAGGNVYPGSFVGYYLQKVIYYDFPLWVFATGYTAFALLILIMWIIWPPRRPRLGSGKNL